MNNSLGEKNHLAETQKNTLKFETLISETNVFFTLPSFKIKDVKVKTFFRM